MWDAEAESILAHSFSSRRSILNSFTCSVEELSEKIDSFSPSLSRIFSSQFSRSTCHFCFSVSINSYSRPLKPLESVAEKKEEDGTLVSTPHTVERGLFLSPSLLASRLFFIRCNNLKNVPSLASLSLHCLVKCLISKQFIIISSIKRFIRAKINHSSCNGLLCMLLVILKIWKEWKRQFHVSIQHARVEDIFQS